MSDLDTKPLIHAKLLDDTRLCPDGNTGEFATVFLDIVTCPTCASRMAGIQWRLEHHAAEGPGWSAVQAPTPAPVLDLSRAGDKTLLVALGAAVALLTVVFVVAIVLGQVS